MDFLKSNNISGISKQALGFLGKQGEKSLRIIGEHIERVAYDPRGEGKHLRYKDHCNWSHRIGDVRLIYQLACGSTVKIVHIKARGSVYRR